MNHPNSHNRQTPFPWWAGVAAGLLALALGCAWWLMQGKHPEATSPESLVLMRALYTACSSQNVERLDKVEREIQRTHQAGKLSLPELESFQAIIAQARDGQWEAAAQESYQFAADQVRY